VFQTHSTASTCYIICLAQYFNFAGNAILQECRGEECLRGEFLAFSYQVLGVRIHTKSLDTSRLVSSFHQFPWFYLLRERVFMHAYISLTGTILQLGLIDKCGRRPLLLGKEECV
jgi:hypothetical protein